MHQETLIKRLNAIRRTARRRLVAYGLCAVSAGCVASFLGIVLFDWLLRIPGVLRMFVAACFVIGGIAATLHWVVAPLRARLGLDEIAGILEKHFGNLQDRLSSAVDFVLRGTEGGRSACSSSMMRQVVSNTDRLIAGLPLESVLSLRPLVLRMALFALSAAVLAAVVTMMPVWTQTGLYRYMYPLVDIEWPRRVTIVPLTGSEKVAMGESVTVGMDVERGLHGSLRGVVHLVDADGNKVALAMEQDESGKFRATIDAVTRDLRYWFEAGDASTKDRPFTIHVVRRPEVVEALATVEPPSYVVGRAARIHDLADGPVSAVIGGIVTLGVRASKPIPEGAAGLRVESAESGDGKKTSVPMVTDPAAPTLLSARFAVEGDMHFRIELRDHEGFENRRAVLHSILAGRDAPPSVTIVEPTAVTEVTPHGNVRFVVRVEDDFGIASLGLQAERPPDGRPYSLALTEELAAAGEANPAKATIQFDWDIKPLRVSPGDMITCHVSAEDNYPAGQTGRSEALRIRIISDMEFDSRVREELALLAGRMRRIALDEAGLLDRTSVLIQPEGEEKPFTAEQRAAVGDLAARQSRLIRRVTYASRRFAGLGERMERNRASDTEARDQVLRAGAALDELATGPMAGAGVALVDAGGRGDASRQQDLLRKTARDLRTAIDRLHSLNRSVSQWGSFQSLVSTTRDLFDRQQAARAQTATIGKSTLGKSVDSLTSTEAATIKRVQRIQEQLAVDVEDLLARMSRLRDATKGKDPSGAGAIDAALRAARARNVVKRLRAAADAIALNRTAAADIDQRAASEAIRKMLEALRERDSRELVLLRKRLQRGEDQVALLLEEQRVLRSATHESDMLAPSADAGTYDSLGREQRRLRRNAGSVAEELSETERAASATRAVRLADAPMGRAEAHLNDAAPRDAVASQDKAIELLGEALDRLEELAREAAEREFRHTLAQVREGLEAIREGQKQVTDAVSKLSDVIKERGHFQRPEAREAARLARKQAKVRGMLDEIMPRLLKVPVYKWALDRVGGWMDTCTRGLDGRRVDDELVALARRIVRELEKLIGAIDETQSLRSDIEFAEAEGGGASGRTLASKPVPTIAELFVLKAMQTDINRRTEALFRSTDLENATEAQLREFRAAGEDQEQVRRLTDLVTRNARQH